MKGNGKGKADYSGFERKRAKQAERRRPHVDKYADRSNNTKEADRG